VYGVRILVDNDAENEATLSNLSKNPGNFLEGMKKTTKTFSVINRRYCFSEFITQNILTPSTK